MTDQNVQKPIHPSSGSSRGGKWFLVFLGLSVAMIGALFVWLLARSYLRAREMHAWPEVACVILSSEIRERIHDPHSPVEYQSDVTFGYEWENTARTSDLVGLRGNPWTSKRNLAESRAAEYPVGKITTCWVNPENPDLAVLKPDSLGPGYSIWFPGLFVVGGLGIVVRALRSR